MRQFGLVFKWLNTVHVFLMRNKNALVMSSQLGQSRWPKIQNLEEAEKMLALARELMDVTSLEKS